MSTNPTWEVTLYRPGEPEQFMTQVIEVPSEGDDPGYFKIYIDCQLPDKDAQHNYVDVVAAILEENHLPFPPQEKPRFYQEDKKIKMFLTFPLMDKEDRPMTTARLQNLFSGQELTRHKERMLKERERERMLAHEREEREKRQSRPLR